MAEPKIAVIGAGAVGSYYGAMLALAGRQVHFLFRRDYEHVSRHGLMVRTRGDERTLFPVHACKEVESIGPCDIVIIAVKATANAALPALLEPLLKKDTILLTLQNGLGNEEFLAERFGGERVMGGLCFICLNRVAPGVVENFLPGYMAIGDYAKTKYDRGERIAVMFRDAGVECSVSESLAEARWRKLVWNIPFNGLAIAAGGINTRGILDDEGLRELAEMLMRETIVLACAAGVKIEEEFIGRQFELTEGMGGYKPSSLIDFLAGREVEVEAIWGEPLRRARSAGIETPRLETLYWLLRALTKKAVRE